MYGTEFHPFFEKKSNQSSFTDKKPRVMVIRWRKCRFKKGTSCLMADGKTFKSNNPRISPQFVSHDSKQGLKPKFKNMGISKLIGLHSFLLNPWRGRGQWRGGDKNIVSRSKRIINLCMTIVRFQNIVLHTLFFKVYTFEWNCIVLWMDFNVKSNIKLLLSNWCLLPIMW